LNKQPSVARIKVELQEKGIRIPPELVGRLEAHYNAPAVSTGRIVVCLDSPKGDGELLPVFIVNGKRGAASPYQLTETSPGTFEVRKENAFYTNVTLIPRPPFYNRLTSGNIPMYKVAVIVGPGHLRSVVDQRCVYQQTGQACKFCAVQYWWNAAAVKQSEQVAETALAGYADGSVKHISMTTATLNTPDRGLANLVKTVKLIHAGAKIPMMLESEPLLDHALLKSLLLEAKANGVTSISINIECFDRELSPDIMPAKGKIPFAEYMKNWEIALNIFGKNEVSTVAVVGIGEDDASLLKGIETAASVGVMTFLVPHSPAVGAVFEDMEPPSAERMLALYEKAVGIYQKYGLDMCACTAGCVRGGGFSAIKDVARFGV
jgi:radical SAM protein (TIGR04043 family)